MLEEEACGAWKVKRKVVSSIISKSTGEPSALMRGEGSETIRVELAGVEEQVLVQT